VTFKNAIALTGGIATGKSSVVKILDFPTIDADRIAHEILDSQQDKIAKLFGNEFIKDNRVNRKALGSLIFSNSKAKKKLEQFIHPLIYDKIEQLSSQNDKLNEPYIIDIPLFFETNRYPIKKSLLVYAPKEIQLKRLMQRDSLSQKEAQQRIESQMDIELKKEKATYLIDNSQDLKTLQAECARVKELVVFHF
jgi:dephospho-CoA kinase